MIRGFEPSQCASTTKGAQGEECFWFSFINIYLAVVAVGMWESQAAFLPDFSKRLREAMLFIAFRGRVISTAGLRVRPLTF